jgi:hypothetical protein
MITSRWLFLYDLYYDAQIHEHQVCKLGLHVRTCSKEITQLKK